MKKVALFMALIFLNICPAWAEETDSAEDKARELHRLASSDVIYQDQETKAIYYQNVQMIALLKQIRDILDERLKEPQAESNPIE